MRDVRRIDRILDKIKILWEVYPDQRLGQLLQNYAFGRLGDIFFIEDDESEKNIDAVLKHIKDESE